MLVLMFVRVGRGRGMEVVGVRRWIGIRAVAVVVIRVAPVVLAPAQDDLKREGRTGNSQEDTATSQTEILE